MKKLILLLVMVLPFCTQEKKKPSDLEILSAVYFSSFTDECVSEYGTLSSLYDKYLPTFPPYNGGKAFFIADSTIDLSRSSNPWEPTTDNRAVSGNTACDFLNQMRTVPFGYETAIIASMDGNGILRNVSSEVSIKTLKKVTDYAVNILKVRNVILFGVHSIKLQSANLRKNPVNAAMKAYAAEKGYCFIDTVALWGQGETTPATDDMMLTLPTGDIDNIHYNPKYYPILKSKVLSQCGLII